MKESITPRVTCAVGGAGKQCIELRAMIAPGGTRNPDRRIGKRRPVVRTIRPTGDTETVRETDPTPLLFQQWHSTLSPVKSEVGGRRFPKGDRSDRIHRIIMGAEAMTEVKVIVEKHPDGYVAYPLGCKGVVVGQGDTYDEALADVKSAIKFHMESFGPEVLNTDAPVLEVFVAETRIAV